MTIARELWSTARRAADNGEDSEALRIFALAAQSNVKPRSGEDLASWARVLKRNGQTAEARKRYREAAALLPVRVEIVREVADELLRWLNAEESVRLIEDAFAATWREADRSTLFEILAGVAPLLGGLDAVGGRATRLLAQAAASQRGRLQLAWARALAAAGFPAAALVEYRRLAPPLRDRPDVALETAEAELAVGEPARAQATLEAALARPMASARNMTLQWQNSGRSIAARLHQCLARSLIALGRGNDASVPARAALAAGGKIDPYLKTVFDAATSNQTLMAVLKSLPAVTRTGTASAWIDGLAFHDIERAKALAVDMARHVVHTGSVALALAAHHAPHDPEKACGLLVRGTRGRDPYEIGIDPLIANAFGNRRFTAHFESRLDQYCARMGKNPMVGIARLVQISAPELSLRLLEQVIRADPASPVALETLAAMRTQKAEPVDGVIRRIAAEQSGRTPGQLYRDWGNTLMLFEGGFAALEPLRRARKVLGDDPELLRQTAAALSSAGRRADALQFLQSLSGAPRDDESILRDLAQLQLAEGKYPDACETLASLIVRDHPEASLLADLERAIRGIPDAREILRRVETVIERKDAPAVWTSWAGVLVAAGEKERAAHACERAVVQEFAIDDAVLARVLDQFAPDDPVLEHFGALASRSDCGNAHQVWALTMQRLRLLNRALTSWEATSRYFESDVLHQNWGRVLTDCDRHREAIEHLSHAHAIATSIGRFAVAQQVASDLAYAHMSRLPDETGFRAAVTRLREVAAAEGADPTTRFWAVFNWALALDRQGRWEESLAKYRELESLFPDHPYPTHNIWALLADHGDYRHAEAARQAAIAKYHKARRQTAEGAKPSEPFASFDLATNCAYFAWLLVPELSSSSTLDATAAYDRIHRLCRQGLALDPNNTVLLTLLVRLNLDKKIEVPDLPPGIDRSAVAAESWAAYRRAAAVLRARIADCETAALLAELGRLHLLVGDFPAAQAALRRSLELDGLNHEVHNLLGMALTRSEEHTQAIRHFEAALSRQPHNLDAWSNLAETCMKANQTARARREYEAILRTAPNHVESLIGLSDLYVREGDAAKKANPAGALLAYARAAPLLERVVDCCGNGCGSKKLSARELGEVNYSRGYIAAMRYEAEGRENASLLDHARDHFRLVPDGHDSYSKAQGALERIEQRVGRLRLLMSVDRIGPMAVFGLALLVFLMTQVRQVVPLQWVPEHYVVSEQVLDELAAAKMEKAAIDKLKGLEQESPMVSESGFRAVIKKKLGDDLAAKYESSLLKAAAVEGGFRATKAPDHSAYVLLTFGSLIFIVAGLYMRHVLKLKIGPIELEKASLDQISAPVSLGISR